ARGMKKGRTRQVPDSPRPAANRYHRLIETRAEHAPMDQSPKLPDEPPDKLPEIPPIPEGTRVVFHFTGGPDDGRRLKSDSRSPWNRAKFLGFYCVTGGGQVGRNCMGASQFAWRVLLTRGPWALVRRGLTRAHRYEVTARAEEGGAIVVRLEHR